MVKFTFNDKTSLLQFVHAVQKSIYVLDPFGEGHKTHGNTAVKRFQ